MIETHSSPDHVAAFRITGTLTAGDYEQVIAGVADKLSRHERIGVLVDLAGFEDFRLRHRGPARRPWLTGRPTGSRSSRWWPAQ